MKVYVQCKKDNPGTPFSTSSALCLEGFAQRGWEAEYFEPRDIPKMEISAECPVIGSVGTLARIFSRLGIASVQSQSASTYPPCLEHYLGRRIGEIPLSELPQLLERISTVFVKPAADDKAFTGFLCRHPDDRWLPQLSPLPPGTRLAWSEPVTFLTEYRVYVLNGNILNIARYRGPVDHQPSVRAIREMIATLGAEPGAPISFALDVGVTAQKGTLLVEVNEALALSNYGLPPAMHAKMHAARWFQIVGKPGRMMEEAECVDSPPFLL